MEAKQNSSPNFQFSSKRGFTLVELLVVIGIIAVLIGFLLPACHRARQQALKTSCLSNLRQLYVAVQEYSFSSRDRIPTGYDYYAGSNYVAAKIGPTVHPLDMLGMLDNLNLLRNPQIAYCPAERDPFFQFNTIENPWPLATARYNFVGYGTRPDADWEWGLDGLEVLHQTLAKLTQLPTHTAILADTFPEWSSLSTRHGDGVNVCYSDGSAHWVPAGPTLLPLKKIPAFDCHQYNTNLAMWGYNTIFFDQSGSSGIWNQFDKL